MNEDALLYVGQKAFIKKGDAVLILSSKKFGIDYPGGKIKKHELTTPEESLKREVLEETGLRITVGRPFATWTNVFQQKHPLERKCVFLIGYKCDYLSGNITLSPEHDSFLWVTKDNYKKLDDGTPYFKILKKYFED